MTTAFNTKITNPGAAAPPQTSALLASLPARYAPSSGIQGSYVPQQAANGPESREFSMKVRMAAGNNDVPGGISRLLSSLQDSIFTK
jgi:hypothetical protein